VTVENETRFIVGQIFYENCIQTGRAKDKGSLFADDYYPKSKFSRRLEAELRRHLQRHWLSLNMSDEEREFAESNPRDLRLKPISEIDLKKFGHGLEARSKVLQQVGIYLILDFAKVYAHELTLTEHLQWQRLEGSMTKKMIEQIMSAVKAELAKQDFGVVRPPREVELWLETSRLTSTNPDVQAACDVLLTQIRR
jgi:hypothetical protein